VFDLLASLRKFDVQAKAALTLAVVSAIPFLCAALLTARNWNSDLDQITYGVGSRFVPLLLACLLLSMAPSALGFLLGWSSAGQRRNDRSSWSWVGFFLGGLIFTLDFILLLAFWKLRLAIPLN